MKTQEQTLAELKLILGAIKQVRERWIANIHAKMEEAKTYNPAPSDTAAFSAAIGSEEVHASHLDLVNLYGVLGGQAAEFEQALEQIVAQDKVPARLKVA